MPRLATIMTMLLKLMILCVTLFVIDGFQNTFSNSVTNFRTSMYSTNSIKFISRTHTTELKMNFFDDAARFFTNLNKEASAKHILMTGSDANNKLNLLKTELEASEDISAAFSELASKVSECPSGKRGGNLGTFKPGMMVKEFDRVCFEKEVGIVHGPVETQFGSHLILVTRRYEGDEKK